MSVTIPCRREATTSASRRAIRSIASRKRASWTSSLVIDDAFCGMLRACRRTARSVRLTRWLPAKYTVFDLRFDRGLTQERCRHRRSDGRQRTRADEDSVWSNHGPTSSIPNTVCATLKVVGVPSRILISFGLLLLLSVSVQMNMSGFIESNVGVNFSRDESPVVYGE